jgi:hypothetical protein
MKVFWNHIFPTAACYRMYRIKASSPVQENVDLVPAPLLHVGLKHRHPTKGIATGASVRTPARGAPLSRQGID